MAIAKMYGLALQSAFNKEIDWDEASKIKVMNCTSSYAPNQDTHRYKNQVTNEITGTGYTAGGAIVTGATFTYTAGTNTLMLDANDTSWGPTATFSGVRYSVVYYDTGTASTSPLIGYIDWESDQSVSGSTATINWAATGCFTLTAA